MSIDLASFYTSLITIILIIALGLLLGKIKWLTAKTNRELVNLLLMVFMPAALFSAFPSTYSPATAELFFTGLLAGALVMAVMILAGKLLFTQKLYRGQLRFEAQFAFIFNNATFLGYPLVVTAFGDQGIIPYCGFIVAFNLALFSYGVWLFEQKLSWRFVKNTLTNPNILAVLAGMLLFFLQLQLPTALDSAIGYVAAATTPLSLICIGYMLSTAQIRTLLKQWRLFLIAAIQLVFAPLITWAVLSALQFPQPVVLICTLIQALPTATSLGLFAEKYGGNTKESSQLVVISTLLSVITLPLVITLLFG